MNGLIGEITKIKEKTGAVILAHYYQLPEVQKVADFVGDSLELSLKAEKCDSDKIIFCGVSFMAETASILNPEKVVVLPCFTTCPLADSLTAEDVKMVKMVNKKIPFVAYVNSLAEVKAEANFCCTSSNAVKVVKSIDSDLIFFGPDKNLAHYVSRMTKKRVIPIPENSECYVHAQITVEDIIRIREKYKDAVILVHPECRPEVQEKADFIGSTSQMLKFVKKSNADTIAVGTEVGLIHRMQIENPEKKILPVRDVVCKEMKAITLEKVYNALVNGGLTIKVSEEIAERARKSIKSGFLCSSE